MVTDYPQIVFHYLAALKKVFGHSIWVKRTDFPKFRVLEDDLREKGISSKDYAFTVVSMLKPWAEDKNMAYVPVDVFCGKFAYDKYIKVWKSSTVTISETPEAELLYSERLVAETYIADNLSGNSRTFDAVVRELSPLLSGDWLNLYQSKKYRKSLGEVLDELCVQYRITYAKNYQDLLHKISMRD